MGRPLETLEKRSDLPLSFGLKKHLMLHGLQKLLSTGLRAAEICLELKTSGA